MQTITLDRYDLALLAALQRDGNATNAALGEAVHLSASQISRRLQRLGESGLIAGYVALLDPEAVGLGVTAFAQVILEQHGKAQSESFEAAASALPEVMECFSLSGRRRLPAAPRRPRPASLLGTDDETRAAPAGCGPHQDQHRAPEGQADAHAAARPHRPAQSATAADSICGGLIITKHD